MILLKNKKAKRAFTLVELTITIALFLLVAGLAISYITFMSNFTDRNNAVSARIKQISQVRQEADAWFSYFDRADYLITVSGTQLQEQGEVVIATAQKISSQTIEKEYRLRLALIPEVSESKTELTQMLVAEYPKDSYFGKDYIYNEGGIQTVSRSNRVRCLNVYSVAFFKNSEDWQFVPQENKVENVLRFTIRQRVSGIEYACEVRYL